MDGNLERKTEFGNKEFNFNLRIKYAKVQKTIARDGWMDFRVRNGFSTERPHGSHQMESNINCCLLRTQKEE